MPHPEHLCSHLNEVIDEKCGDVICTDCGLVICDKVFTTTSVTHHDNSFLTGMNKNKNEIDEMLEKLNLPTCFTQNILKNFNNNLSTKNKKELLPYTIYNTLNAEGFPISIKEISAVSGFTDVKIYSMQNNKAIILEPALLLEKYCKLLGLDYNTYAVIKTGLPESSSTGHNPLTIIASTIYCYLKQYSQQKYSMKKIAQTVNTSCISIQRYIKTKKIIFKLK